MSNSQFQLFPRPAPQGVPKNPFRKGPRRPSVSTESTGSTPLEDLKDKGSAAKAVVFQIVEPQSIKPPPKAHIPSLPPRSSTPGYITGSKSESPSESSPQSGRGERSTSHEINSLSGPGDHQDTMNLMPAQSPAQHSASPIIPMKSIFPRYNPDAPLYQQQYYDGTSNNFSRLRYRPTELELDLSSAPEIDRTLGPKTVPASVLNFPAGILDPVEIQYSSSTQLKTLWEAANGQQPDDFSGPFNLRLERLDPATFVFGDPNSPFYTMQTYSTNELSITRANPSLPNSNIPIMMLQLEDRRRRDPPNDGLVSHLFSRLAAMLAIDQAEDLSRQHQLPPRDAKEVETNALKRAAAQESCRVSWNPMKRLYELRHPSLSKQRHQDQEHRSPTPPTLVGAAGIALSPVRPKQPRSGVLHITVSTPSTPVPNQGEARGQNQAPTILVTAPLPSNTVDATISAAASPRTSTLPLSGRGSESDETLASLDLRTMTLSIAASAISDTIPSLYAIDSIVAAVLAVAVSDSSTNPVLADMPLYNPMAQTEIQSQSQTQTQSRYTSMNTPTNRPQLFATLAERDDASRPDPDTQSHTRIPPQTALRKIKWWLPSPSLFRPKNKQKPPKNPRQNTNTPTVIEEIDLEKYGVYGDKATTTTISSSADARQEKEEELPGLVRATLKLFFWGLKLMFWALTVAFKVLGWGLKLVLKCVMGEKV